MPFTGGIGAPELIIILVVVLVLFGPKQLPKLGKMFGKTVKEARKGMDSFNDEMKTEETAEVEDTPAAAKEADTSDSSKEAK
ncbi:MAG: twin-arginine translocase TatA/TatE family subunit [Coriobacteriia bacterium]|nr:twin-arginine translocase TatA/TatE family subunit [Coriobacteriia bacterium]